MNEYDGLKCPFKGQCFARGDNKGECTILNTIPEKECTFQKPEREVTNGVFYKKSEERRERCAKEELPERKLDEWAKDWDETIKRMKP